MALPFLSLVIPTFNEAENIQPLLLQLNELLDRALADRYELIVVDDDSPDRTWALAEQLQPKLPMLTVLRRQGDRGLATAVVYGWQRAQGEILGVIDGDLQHPPETLLALIQTMQAGADLAVASRNVSGGGVSDWSVWRRLGSRGAQLLGLLILPEVLGRVSDPMSGYFMVRRSRLDLPSLQPRGYKILLEVIAKGQIRQIREVGFIFRERSQGESKVTAREYWHYLQHLCSLRLQRWESARFLKFVGAGATGVIVDSVVLYLLHDPSRLGWPLLLSKFIAAEVAILNNFVFNEFWTFGDLARGSQRRYWPRRFLKFNLICSLGIFLNLLILSLLVEGLKLHYLPSNWVAIAVVTLWNFWLNRKLTWVG
ncbi:glycosyltransferase [Synechococcus elongatus]|uniref:glycosyltransferase n=1 Tax=Synechococcus elongatus TaxID=32046 RepID=UPI0000460168|nr:glycosyltransferase [Synechococcus elongatus]MBD2588014.1 glycosyltransferase [Synechococcus elongatus FACHB-242]MBD2689082.1 glycosyltransferase [Synechococcus elongatus FACHB-1061]MBD2707278.1 glycosyltransferase [Synechococcus elongatus PCC 7942 = FACHB-805]WKW05731.1 glycosyltransferase [Synechococcus elongatus PCC 7942 = FACHB-805]